MKNKLDNKEFLEGLIWNYGSLFILSASGFFFNCLIVYFYDAAALGIFNRTYAWYCVLSQITVWGVHMSVLRLTPEYHGEKEEQGTIFLSALFETLLISSVCVGVIIKMLPYIVTENKSFLVSLSFALPGLIFFSLNKVILNYLNGLSEMKAYAFFQSLRYIVIVVSIFIFGKLKYECEWLAFSFTEAEIVLLLFALCYLLYRKLLGRRVSIAYMKEHLKFGTHIIPANMVVELNTKVDIICLGLILKDDYLIGIYSFAILFTEGFYQLYITVRRSINPKITIYHVNHKLQQGIENINEYLKKYLRVLSPTALILLTIGYYMICCILKQRDYIKGIGFLIVICTAIILNGRKIIFGNIFSQTGFPVYESLMNTITVISNFFLNLILIYFMGLLGAAIATAVSHMIYGYVLKYYAKRELGIKI